MIDDNNDRLNRVGLRGILGTKLFIEALLVRKRMTNLFVDSMLMFEDDFYKKEVNGISK